MAEDINPNGPYNTKIPGYNEAADIQEALKLFLYGVNQDGTVSQPSNQSEIVSTSIAGHLKAIQTEIDVIDSKGIGSVLDSSYPESVTDGYIWVDSSSSSSSVPQYAQAVYSTSQPVNPSTGALWVDSDSSPLKMYVYSGTEWKEIGA